MITELVLAAAVVLSGRTDEGRPVRVETTGSRVTRVKGSVLTYECDDFGDVGPLRFDVRVRARAKARTGRFSFVTGDRAERVGVAGYLRDDGTARGRIRVTGTIATGQRCESDIVRFRAKPRR